MNQESDLFPMSRLTPRSSCKAYLLIDGGYRSLIFVIFKFKDINLSIGRFPITAKEGIEMSKECSDRSGLGCFEGEGGFEI